MKHFKEAVMAISRIEDENQLVQLFELAMSKVTIGTIQQIAELEGKSYNGIKNSNRYLKIVLGNKKLVVKGVSDNNLPF
jgi:hypothetical protein|tara:strand:- start:9781 stop:10017 length:237 start_codon:yes stop_codon:yes gene_type:complete